MQRSKRPIRSTEGRLLAWLHISRKGGCQSLDDDWTRTTMTLDGAEPGRLAQGVDKSTYGRVSLEGLTVRQLRLGSFPTASPLSAS